MSDARTSGRTSLTGWRAPGRGLPPGFGVLWTTVAVDLLGFGIVVPLLPLYARHLGAGPASVGLLLAAFSAAQFAGAPVLGRLSDRVGRKPVLIASLAGTAAASLLTGLAGSLWLLLVARVLDGASGGAWRWPRRRPPTSWGPQTAPGCSDFSARPTASGSSSAPP